MSDSTSAPAPDFAETAERLNRQILAAYACPPPVVGRTRAWDLLSPTQRWLLRNLSYIRRGRHG